MAPTRWLDEREQKAWRSYLEATQLVTDATERQLREIGITHAYYEILVRLSEAPGRALRMSDLADASLSSRSRLSHAVARLEEQGWIRRAECASDRRGQIAELTEEGFAALSDAAPGHVAQVRASVFDALTDTQVGELTTICQAIVAHLSPILGAPNIPPCPTAASAPSSPPDRARANSTSGTASAARTGAARTGAARTGAARTGAARTGAATTGTAKASGPKSTATRAAAAAAPTQTTGQTGGSAGR